MCRSFYRLGRLDRTSRSLTFSTFSSLGSSSASLHHVGGGEYQTFARNRLFSMPRRKIGLFPIKSMADNDQGNLGKLRSMPLVAGGIGILGTLVNRLMSGISPTISASSSQSRVDVIAIFCSAVLILTGLQWLSLKPKIPPSVILTGENVMYFDDKKLPALVQKEIEAAWMAMSWASKTEIMVVFYKGTCVAHLGRKRSNYKAGTVTPGTICLDAQRRGTGNYLANLSLYPGRQEFFEYLPENTQSLIIRPCGKYGIVVVGANAQRGFTILDQAWISFWTDKLEVAFERLHQ